MQGPLLTGWLAGWLIALCLTDKQQCRLTSSSSSKETNVPPERQRQRGVVQGGQRGHLACADADDVPAVCRLSCSAPCSAV